MHVLRARTALLALALASAGAPVAARPQGAPRPALPAGTPEAHETWRAFCRAMRSGDDLEPVRAFLLDAQVRSRDGTHTNELDVRYHFLEPSFIRFRLPRDKETGRGPGERGGYWLRDGETVIPLAGREYKEDRDLVQRMLSLATNFVSLTDPERIRLERLERLERPELLLDDVSLKRLARRLEWIRVASPSFALSDSVTDDGRGTATDDGKETVYRVDLGLEPETRLPTLVAICRDAQPKLGEPMPALLIHLQDFRGQSGFVVPHLLLVYSSADSGSGLVFGGRPSQEIAVLNVDLRPQLTPQDFLP